MGRIGQQIKVGCLSFAAVLLVAVGVHAQQDEGDSPLPLQRVERSSLDDLQAAMEADLASRELPLLGWDDRLWEHGDGDRANLLTAIHHSLEYLQTPAAEAAYANYPVPGITLARVQRSLERFRQLVMAAQSPSELQWHVLAEFDLYQSVGSDGAGTVTFTGYFEPTYAASRVPTDEFRYPLYRKPIDLDGWSLPHPTRAELEGRDGLRGSEGWLRGDELVWLGDRLEAFLIQVQGSARLQLTDGTEMSVGYAGRTDYEYRSIGRMLVEDGHIPEAELSLPKVLDFFEQHPDALDIYLPQNNRFVFFRETYGAPPQGTLSVPVTAERAIATDKSIMPPGALALIVTDLPFPVPQRSSSPAPSPSDSLDSFTQRRVSRYVLDQDTGGAIQGPGRVDIFMGAGNVAGERAGLINGEGALYYLLLRDPAPVISNTGRYSAVQAH